MLRPRYLFGLVLILSSCSSGGGKPSAGNDVPSFMQSSSAAASHAPAAAATSDQPAIPKGAQYTLYCSYVGGNLHVELANQMRKDLILKTGMPDWYVVHQADRSSLYYGYYRAIADPSDVKESTRAQADRQKIDGMVDSVGNRPFAHALFVELIAPDPVAPPEWNLVNANGKYTIQIGVYKGSAERKVAAVEAVRQARAQGIEAYYYHGDAESIVCVGAWPESALRITGGQELTDADPSKPLVVVPKTGDAQIDSDFDSALKAPSQDGTMRVSRPQVEVADSTMAAVMKQFPYNTVNGNYMMHQSRDGRQTYDPSWIVQIPAKTEDASIQHTQQNSLSSGQAGTFDPNYRPQLPRQTDPPSQQPSGRLRAIPGG